MTFLTLILIIIILVAAMVMYFHGRSRDICLRDFEGFPTTLQETSGRSVSGKLFLEPTGVELVYPKPTEKNGNLESSYILYKHEFDNLLFLTRFHDELTEEQRRSRDTHLKEAYNPKLIRRVRRHAGNTLRIMRDSIVEVFNVLISAARRNDPRGTTLISPPSHVTQMGQEVYQSVGTSYDPLLEKHLGQRVITELIKGDKIVKFSGVLKEYTAGFVELIDVDLFLEDKQEKRQADMVLPRKYAVVRNLGQ